MYNTDHLAALNIRLSNETARHGDNPKMANYLESIRREIKGEEKFLADRGVNVYANECDDMSDDDLLDALGL